MRIYIVGPNAENFMSNFSSAENELNAAGHEVVNPAKLKLMVPPTYTSKEYRKICIPLLDSCDAIFCLKGWQRSNYANMMVARCMETGKAIFFEQGGQNGQET